MLPASISRITCRPRCSSGPDTLSQTKKIFGDDFFPYGVKANHDMVQTAINFSHEQGFIKSKPRVEDIFVEQVRDL